MSSIKGKLTVDHYLRFGIISIVAAVVLDLVIRRSETDGFGADIFVSMLYIMAIVFFAVSLLVHRRKK